jgi:hypothetical protein
MKPQFDNFSMEEGYKPEPLLVAIGVITAFIALAILIVQVYSWFK